MFLLSIGLGAGDYFSRQNRLIFLAALIGLVAWYLTESAAYTLAITITISLLGGSVTVLKAYEDPESETLSTWILMVAVAIFAVLSVGRYDPVILAYPLYLLTLYSAIVLAIIFGRAKRTKRAETALPVRFRSAQHGREPTP